MNVVDREDRQSEISIDQFFDVRVRAATVLQVLPFPEARNPAYKLELDFGEFGRRWSSAQITGLYAPENLVGTQVLAVVNLPAKRVAGFKSECLVLGVYNPDGHVVLVRPDRPVPNGGRLT
jgi:tRNA-binding protein